MGATHPVYVKVSKSLFETIKILLTCDYLSFIIAY